MHMASSDRLSELVRWVRVCTSTPLLYPAMYNVRRYTVFLTVQPKSSKCRAGHRYLDLPATRTFLSLRQPTEPPRCSVAWYRTSPRTSYVTPLTRISFAQLSKEDEEATGDEIEVRREDQDKINKFSRLHQRELLLEEELQGKNVSKRA